MHHSAFRTTFPSVITSAVSSFVSSFVNLGVTFFVVATISPAAFAQSGAKPAASPTASPAPAPAAAKKAAPAAATPSATKKGTPTATKETQLTDRIPLVMTVSVNGKEKPIEIELYGKEAPVSTANFLKYVDDGFYNGTIFHRVIKDFMIQGGGMTPGMNEKDKKAPSIKNEADNGMKNTRGTLAMARTNDPNSASSQFFINHADNQGLDHTGKTSSQAWGYAVFGKVTKGMEVVDEIAKVPTQNSGHHQNVPVADVKIVKITRKETK